MPALLRGKETSPDHHARIIHTSSGVAYLHTLSFDTFRDSPARKALGPPTLYAQSKFVSLSRLLQLVYALTRDILRKGNAIVSKELARRYADQGIISIALNPGAYGCAAVDNALNTQQETSRLSCNAIYPTTNV